MSHKFIITIFLVQGIVLSTSTHTNKLDRSPKIIDGEDAMEGQFPFMVSLNYHEDDLHHCGGSILTNKWVLTAAHCCYTRGKPQYVYSGSIYLNGTGQKHEIVDYILGENWGPDDFHDDLCLIKIDEEFHFNETVQPIVLPVQDWSVDDGERANVTGWGRIATDDDVPPNTLQVGYNFVVRSNEQCQNLTNVDMYEGWLCAQGSHAGQSICFGDSGSPLFKDGIQIGIVSFLQRSNCEENVAEFYTRVPKYVNWIIENLGSDASYLNFAK